MMTESTVKKLEKKLSVLEKENEQLKREISGFRDIINNLKKKPLLIGTVERVLNDGE